MTRWLNTVFSFRISTDPHDRIKLFFLCLSFFFVIGGYTVMRTLKDALFANMVGGDYIGWAKAGSIVILIPAILLFSKLVDLLKRYQLLYIYSLLYGVGGLVIAYLIGHPEIGLVNTVVSKYRVFGWVIYFFFEGMNPFLVSLVWSFSHSITSPDEAKVNYPLMVAASKVGGMITASLACWFLLRHHTAALPLSSDVMNLQVLLGVSSALLLTIPVMLFWFVRKVPSRYLHGYEAAYQVEKQEAKHAKRGVRAFFSTVFSGFAVLIRYPYALGIFGIMFFWEIVNVFLNLERIGAANRAGATLSHKTFFMLEQDFWVHAVGFVITLAGTRIFLNLLGERRSLLVVPFMVGLLILFYFSVPSVEALTYVFILTRSINYAFAAPLRESLFIPTTKEIKFKAKAWIEAFGVKVAKGVGGGFSAVLAQLARVSQTMVFAAGVGFFSVIILLWVVVAHLLGRRFERAVARNEVIGTE